MFQVLILLYSIILTDISVTDTSGVPVIGASICADSTLIGITDTEGSAPFSSGYDSIEVHAVGYAAWEGPPPPSGNIILTPVAVPSGMVISVTASRSGFRNRFPSTTALDRSDIEFIARGGLRKLNCLSSGIYVREYGGAMPVISISLRGSDPGHTDYFVDGHDISSSMDGLPGLTLDPAIFGGVEIARGGGSGFLKGGMAGTLNFQTESSELPSRASLSAADDGGMNISCGITAGRNRLAFSFRRLVGLESSIAHDGTFLFSGNAHALRYGFMAAASGGGTESPDWAAPTDGRRQRYSLDAWLRLNTGNYIISTGISSGRHLFRSTIPAVTEDTHDEFRGSLTLERDIRLTDFNLHLAGKNTFEKIWSTALGERERLSGDLSVSSGYIDAISLSASARLSAASASDTRFGAVISAGASGLDSMLIFHTRGALGIRRPTFNDLYWPEDNFAIGNPDLLPESSLEAEAGISVTGWEFLRLSATGFLSVTDDLIRWEPGSDGKWSPVNISNALRKGVETELWFSHRSLAVRGSFTLLSVTDNSPESTNYRRTLPYSPDYTFGLETGFDIIMGIHCSISLSGMGIRFKNYSETSWLSAYTIVSASLDLPLAFARGFSIGSSAENLFNEEYQETNGYGGKPRTFSFRIKWNN